MNLKMKTLAAIVITFFVHSAFSQDVGIWTRFEKSFTSSSDYSNALYDVRLDVKFISPTGREENIRGFWDGGRSWKVRFMPDEKGKWTWTTLSSDKANTGLNSQSGSFNCTSQNLPAAIYRNGPVTRSPGLYYLHHSDGTPFFWTACTAWNGTLKSTDEEWTYYLKHRARNNYNVIQFVTTQWRGGDKNSFGQVAFDGSGAISINPEFFQHLDRKIDQINQAGLVAAPVLLWALPVSRGRDLSPGYYLPEEEAILLARYMVARYGGNHVVWILGGDGKYLDKHEQRWKNIGRAVFGDAHPGLVALHPSGKDWLGDAYGNEEWLDIVGYQTGHNNSDATVSWMTKGPVSQRWDKIPPKILINMEPVYEEINPNITADDVRRASYWSLLSTPTAGITYGANGIWPWLREGESILNHAGTGETNTRVLKALDLPGSTQVGYLSAFFKRLEWWTLKPAPDLLIDQPGDGNIQHFISVSRTDDRKIIVVYVPSPSEFSLHNPGDHNYEGFWFNTETNKTTSAFTAMTDGFIRVPMPPGKKDQLLVLTKSPMMKK